MIEVMRKRDFEDKITQSLDYTLNSFTSNGDADSAHVGGSGGCCCYCCGGRVVPGSSLVGFWNARRPREKQDLTELAGGHDGAAGAVRVDDEDNGIHQREETTQAADLPPGCGIGI